MTKLKELMEQGWTVMTSPLVKQGEPFIAGDPAIPGDAAIVFHPLDYNYIAFEDPFEAHAHNMEYIYAMIDDRAKDALKHLDDLVYYYEHRNDPRIITFLHHAEVTENEDGSFTFFAQAGDAIANFGPKLPREQVFAAVGQAAEDAAKAMNEYASYFEEDER